MQQDGPGGGQLGQYLRVALHFDAEAILLLFAVRRPHPRVETFRVLQVHVSACIRATHSSESKCRKQTLHYQ